MNTDLVLKRLRRSDADPIAAEHLLALLEPLELDGPNCACRSCLVALAVLLAIGNAA